MIFSFSVPSKIILLGDHAAIYGFPSIATAIDLRMYLKCSLIKDNSKSEIRIKYNNDKFDFNPFSPPPDNENSTFKMYRKAFQHHFPQNHILNMNFTFNGPDSSGLGSSSSLCTLVAATVQHITNQVSIDKEKLIAQAIELEQFYHSKSSGIDVHTVVNGLSTFIDHGKIQNITLPQIPILIVDSGVKRQSKTALNHVSDLMENDKENAWNKLKSLGKIAEKFYKCKKAADLGSLFNESQILLSSLGLSCPQINDIIKIANNNNLNAKITGAGMGGVVIVTGENLFEKQAVFKPYKTFPAHLESEGFKFEKNC